MVNMNMNMMSTFLTALATAARDPIIINKTRAIDAVFRVFVAHKDMLWVDMTVADLRDVLKSCLDVAFAQYEYTNGYIDLFIAHDAVRRGYLIKTHKECINDSGNWRVRVIYNLI
jgi:hypothetical protein